MISKIYIRNILLALILVLLVLLVVLLRNRSPFGKRETNFATEPRAEITAIELTGKGHTVLLSLIDGIWMVNREVEAREIAVIFMLKVLKEMKIKSPVSPEMFNEEIVSGDIKPVRVNVYEKRKLLRSFYVYRTRTNKYGNIMKINERAKPFIVYFPGYEDDIGSIFNPLPLFWKPYTIFNLLPSEINSVTLENFSDAASSFSIKITDNTFTLSDLYKNLTGWDSAKVKRYLSYFTLVPFEAWAFDPDGPEFNSFDLSSPAYRISLTGTDGKTTRLTLWERFTDGKKDTGRLWGKTDKSEEFFIIRYFDIDPLLRKITYFFPEE